MYQVLFGVLTLTKNGDTCHLLITFANSFDPDQDRQNFGPDLDTNHSTLCVPEFFF